MPESSCFVVIIILGIISLGSLLIGAAEGIPNARKIFVVTLILCIGVLSWYLVARNRPKEVLSESYFQISEVIGPDGMAVQVFVEGNGQVRNLNAMFMASAKKGARIKKIEKRIRPDAWIIFDSEYEYKLIEEGQQ